MRWERVMLFLFGFMWNRLVVWKPNDSILNELECIAGLIGALSGGVVFPLTIACK